jgi:hypothetical protein
MIRKCCVCKKILGEVEPIDDKSVTHTYCEPCTKKVWEDLELAERKTEAEKCQREMLKDTLK